MLAPPDLTFYALQASTPFIRLYRADGTHIEANHNAINPVELASWVFQNIRPTLLHPDTDFHI